MKIALAQLNYRIGDFERNGEKIVSTIRSCREQGADLVVFAELAVSGYPPRDFLEFDHFIQQCESTVKMIAQECQGIAAIVGSPSFNPASSGKPLLNSAYFLENGAVRSIHHKALLPNYDVFDEYRYFEPASDLAPIEFQGHRIALTICEDLWYLDEEQIYTRHPMEELAEQGADLMINISASPFDHSHLENRIEVLQRSVERFSLPLYYVNQWGGQTELLFDGRSLTLTPGGGRTLMKGFEEEVRIFNTQEGQSPSDSDPLPPKTKRLHDGLITGIRDYFDKLGFTRAVVGLSGGIDSALTLALAAEALGRENVRGVLMPSPFSSEHSIRDSEELIGNIGCASDTLPIDALYETFNETLSPLFKDTAFGAAEENIQARTRAVLLMAISNKFGDILLNTSNKSELAVGYGTLYGDMCGGLSVLGDLYKYEVYELARFLNQERTLIPRSVMDKAPSAELRPNQQDTDNLPEYAVLDPVLYAYIEEQKGPEEIIEQGFPRETVEKVLKMVNTSEYKRYQSPPILRVSPKAFGMGRRMPIVAKYLS